MQPSDYQYPVDYLNNIAPAPAPRKSLRLFLIAGGVLVAAIIIFIALAVLTRGGSASSLQTVSARLPLLTTTVSGAQINIQSSSLRAINSNLTSYLNAASSNLKDPLTAAGVSSGKLPKSVIAAEKKANDTLTTTLQNAKLNATFDRTYAREMDYQIKKLLLVISQASASTRSNSLQSALNDTATNLTAIQQQLDNYIATSTD